MAKKNDNGIRKWAIFSGIGIQMGVIIGIGVYLGVTLDEKYPNSYSAFTVIFSLSSVFLAMYAIIKQLQKINKNDPDS